VELLDKREEIMNDSFALMVSSIWAGIAVISYFAAKNEYPAWSIVALTTIGGVVTIALSLGRA
jgi:hypothetical protein